MPGLNRLLDAARHQYLAFLYLTLLMSALTVITMIMDPEVFDRFLGTLPPQLVFLSSVLLGFASLTLLVSKTSLRISQKNSLKDYLTITVVAVLFGFEVVVADIWLVRYPAGINVMFPESLFFYPVAGYIAEVFLHLVPLSVLTLFLMSFKRLSPNQVLWISITLVVMAEPLFQVWIIRDGSMADSIYTGLHVLAFSFTQLLIFRRYGFISMFFLRLVFYLVWHILWGTLRLNILF